MPPQRPPVERGIAPDRDAPPRVRHGDAAVREELDAAVSTGTADALELFLRRHPSHPLAREASERLHALGRR